MIHKKDDELFKYTKFLDKLTYIVLDSKSYYVNWCKYLLVKVNKSKQDRISNRIKSLKIQKQEWSVIILILDVTYNVTESVLLIRSMFYMCRNIYYKVYLLDKMSDETLCKNINNEKSNKKQHVLQELMRICQ